LSELKVIIDDNYKPLAKMYMYGKNNIGDRNVTDYNQRDRTIFTLHSEADNLLDRGISVINSICWQQLIDFFKAIPSQQEVNVFKKFQSNDKEWIKKANTTINLIIF
jgi:hypothetical protein